jgi:hypothetical protein
MYEIQPLPMLEMKWGVVDDTDRPLLFVELNRPPECEVYEFEEHHPSGRGALLATFFGPNAIDRACEWITSVELPRLLRPDGSKPDQLLPPPKEANATEGRDGVEERMVR